MIYIINKYIIQNNAIKDLCLNVSAFSTLNLEYYYRPEFFSRMTLKRRKCFHNSLKFVYKLFS